MGISAVDKLINIENLTLSPSVKLGDKKNVNVNVAGNLVINQAYAGTVSANNPDLIVEESKELLSSGKTSNTIDINVKITLSPYIGVVKSPNLPGTRIHMEFTTANSYDSPQVIKGAYVKFGDGQLHFKLFFKINENGSRQPDLAIRFPIIVNSKGTTRLAMEFENFDVSLIHKGTLKGELVILTGEEKIAKKEFEFEVNEAMVNTLDQLQKIAERNKSPVVFDAMIKS
ncbi:hypothetical protein A3A46_03600 [Candidatus Roizmanbacteria bacterium RIFCSPLOWO2_01_FULL_37_13]|uniref:Uncharacterized protein n=1 Tax=Candidatus Roizmanbacteria bacterium RIFCSPHIGHO2_02_FULL_38_11 TaxID=1802039 RepID=A0A1F7GYT6_9BACT|nr:MAG: hypothetical protein A3C25_04860 [Candidatus Roizmanbacteria bacterium RIFCSPHIGHO2_02_FULL_38_11]OGK42717.1 MAG: hypothetical protein A3A46_03600 [Candidatus Roizmanbacteria bacterium RIFCSPLOWO2_01_FULL_37_13]